MTHGSRSTSHQVAITNFTKLTKIKDTWQPEYKPPGDLWVGILGWFLNLFITKLL